MQAGAETRHPNLEDEGIEVSLLSDQSPQLVPGIPAKNNNVEAETLMRLWKSLACCYGLLCGHHLGHTVKEGFDCTISWLCCTVVFGPQVLAEQAEKRWDKQSYDDREIIPEDFDLRPPEYQLDEESFAKHPLPIPDVLSSLKVLAKQIHAVKEGLFCVLLLFELLLLSFNVCRTHSMIKTKTIVEAELSYVIGTLEYIVAWITSKEIMSLSLRRRNGLSDEQGVISTGCFLNLHCGHNNQYSSEEREKLIALIRRSCGDSVLQYIFNETHKESCFIQSNLFTKRTTTLQFE